MSAEGSEQALKLTPHVLFDPMTWPDGTCPCGNLLNLAGRERGPQPLLILGTHNFGPEVLDLVSDMPELSFAGWVPC